MPVTHDVACDSGLPASARRRAATPDSGSRLSRGAAGSGRAGEPAGGSHAARGSRARGRRAGMGWRPRVTRSRRDEGETRKPDAARRGDEQSGGLRRRDGDACVRATVRAAVRRMRLLPAFAVDRGFVGTGRFRAVDLDEAHASGGAHVGEQSCAGPGHHRTTDRRRERTQQHREDREPRDGTLSKSKHVERKKRAECSPLRFLRKCPRPELISVTYSGVGAPAPRPALERLRVTPLRVARTARRSRQACSPATRAAPACARPASGDPAARRDGCPAS